MPAGLASVLFSTRPLLRRTHTHTHKEQVHFTSAGYLTLSSCKDHIYKNSKICGGQSFLPTVNMAGLSNQWCKSQYVEKISYQLLFLQPVTQNTINVGNQSLKPGNSKFQRFPTQNCWNAAYHLRHAVQIRAAVKR